MWLAFSVVAGNLRGGSLSFRQEKHARVGELDRRHLHDSNGRDVLAADHAEHLRGRRHDAVGRRDADVQHSVPAIIDCGLCGKVRRRHHRGYQPAQGHNAGGCYHGVTSNVTFNLSGVTVPTDGIVYGIAFQTRDYGLNGGSGISGPADSLNVALNTFTTPPTGKASWLDSSWSGAYVDNGATGTFPGHLRVAAIELVEAELEKGVDGVEVTINGLPTRLPEP